MKNAILKRITVAFIAAIIFAFALAFSAGATASTTVNATGSIVTLTNNNATITIDKDGISQLFFNGVNQLSTSTRSSVISLTDGSVQVDPTSISAVSESSTSAVITLSFATGLSLRVRVETYDEFVTFELLDSIPVNYSGAKFPNITFGSPYMNSGKAIFAYSLNNNVYMTDYPANSYKKSVANTTLSTAVGTVGAKIALTTTAYDDLFETLRYINENVADDSKTIVSNMGGAYAKTDAVLDKAVRDYIIISDPANLNDDTVRTYLGYNATQFDIHQNATSSFVQGSMTFKNSSYGASVEGFKTNVTDRIKRIAKDEFGLDAVMGLHTYAYYISPSDTTLLSQASVRSQLEYSEVFTLSSNLTTSATKLYTSQSTENFRLDEAFFVHTMNYVLVDDEIMRVSAHGSNNLTVKRGQCGTKAAAHSAGATVKHLSGFFNMFAPQVDSQLFIDIANYTADAYVKGGFGMIYLDALDGIGNHTDYPWYYSALFVQKILERIHDYQATPEYQDVPDPILEYSTMYTSIWAARTRSGANDTVCRGLKEYLAFHSKNNADNQYNFSANIGWWSLYDHEANGPFFAQRQTTDVVDYLGKNIIAYNMSYSYNNFSISELTSHPAHKTNADLLTKYLKLRDAHYFNDSVKNYISDTKKEFRLVDVGNEHVFEEMAYSQATYNDITCESKTFTNKFPAQTPKLIRIEPLLTAGGYVGNLFTYPETQKINAVCPLGSYGVYQTIATSRNLSNAKAIKVRLYGNGKGGQVCFRFDCGDSIWDRVIDIDFTGWRTIVLVELENGYRTSAFSSGRTCTYPYNRTNSSTLQSASILYTGDMTDVVINTVDLYSTATTSFTNPFIRIGDNRIEFNATVTPGEYIEYDGTNAYKYDINGTQTAITASIIGDMIVEKGDFDAIATCVSASTGDARMRVTFGFSGARVGNNDTIYSNEKLYDFSTRYENTIQARNDGWSALGGYSDAKLYCNYTENSVCLSDSVSKEGPLAQDAGLMWTIPTAERVNIKDYTGVRFNRRLENGYNVFNNELAMYDLVLTMDDGQTIRKSYHWSSKFLGLTPASGEQIDDLTYEISSLQGNPKLAQIAFIPYSSDISTFNIPATGNYIYYFLTKYFALIYEETEVMPTLAGVKDTYNGTTVAAHNGKITGLSPYEKYYWAPIYTPANELNEIAGVSEITGLAGGVYSVYSANGYLFGNVIVPKDHTDLFSYSRDAGTMANLLPGVKGDYAISGKLTSPIRNPYNATGAATIYAQAIPMINGGDAYIKETLKFIYAPTPAEQFNIKDYVLNVSSYLSGPENLFTDVNQYTWAIKVYVDGKDTDPYIYSGISYPDFSVESSAYFNFSAIYPDAEGIVTKIEVYPVYDYTVTPKKNQSYPMILTMRLLNANKDSAPAASIVSNEDGTFSISGLDTTKDYLVKYMDGEWESVPAGSSSIVKSDAGDYYIKYVPSVDIRNVNGGVFSEEQKLTVVGIMPNVLGVSVSNDTLTGLKADTTYEYKLKGSADAWTSVSGVTTLTLTPGDYLVRLAATNGYITGASKEFNVTAQILTLKDTSLFTIDEVNKILYLNKANNTAGSVRNNFKNSGTTITGYSSYVGSGAVISLVVDGVTVDSLTIVLIGDANGNGKLDTGDYTAIKNDYLESSELTGALKIAGDTNKNGIIDTGDYLMIKRHIEGSIDLFE